MSRGNYHTKQREELLEFLKSVVGQHITVSDIYNHLSEKGSNVGTTTIYRQLEKMIEEGTVKKYILDSSSAACFEYIDKDKECRESGCVHLKCTSCGKLIHLHCDELTATQDHIYNEHNFKLDMTRTVLYGLCEECQ